jgi:hypothetical protein
MTSGDSDMLFVGGGVSWDDSAALLPLANTFEMLGSWSSYKKTPGETISWLELSFANSSTISFSLVECVGTWDSEHLAIQHHVVIQTWPLFVGLVDNE